MTRMRTLLLFLFLSACGDIEHETDQFVAFNSYLSHRAEYAIGQTIIFDREEYDHGGTYDPDTGTFTAPALGLYTIDAGARINGLNAGNYCNLGLRIGDNQSRVGQITIAHSDNSSLVVGLSVTLLLDKGEQATIHTIHDFGGPREIQGLSGEFQYTWFAGFGVEDWQHNPPTTQGG